MSPPKPLSPFRLASLLRLEKDPQLAFHLFLNPNPIPDPHRNANTPTKPFRYSLVSYDIIIMKLGRAKMFDEMHKILRQLKTETRFVPKEVLFCNVISFYGRAGLPDKALTLFDEIPSFRCQRTIKSINSLLNALLMCEQFDKMMELLVCIEKFAQPDTCTFNIFIYWFCSKGRVDDAWKVFDEMKSRGLSPNNRTFGSLIYGLCLNLKWKEAFELKNNMERVYGTVPNAHIYASLIKALCCVGDLYLAFRLKEEMSKKKVKLDSAIYATLISGLFKVGKKEEAFGLLEEMTLAGCKLDTVTYNVLICEFCKDLDFEAAFKVLNEMVGKGCKPEVISYNIILDRLCKVGKWTEASDLFEDMPRRGCVPDVTSYRILFDGLSKAFQYENATLILDEMIFKGFAPYPVGITNFVDSLCQAKNEDLLLSVLNSLAKGNAIPEHLWKRSIAFVVKEDMLLSLSEHVDSLTS
ncbi:hypothetical protein K2173_022168 [Erythroxylum novogranatense]|uniref:Pentatricopeptide repeat-containing protein n=1 Tax=Erythroxylum novogranatense TaxID=1862640 RepID=A0AAV8SUG5_9ROSI|nr:hypothetical protein K2173_022168 [Erythroxylum novogranatense]